MATVHDVAAYILQKEGELSAMKLQKLVYYSQAWSLVWDDQPLFNEPIEAWANGPVVRSLYARHRGSFKVQSWDGHPDALTREQRDTIDAVLMHYGRKSAHELSELTHAERPWKSARRGLPPGERGNATITQSEMAEYYGSLYEAELGDSR